MWKYALIPGVSLALFVVALVAPEQSWVSLAALVALVTWSLFWGTYFMGWRHRGRRR